MDNIIMLNNLTIPFSDSIKFALVAKNIFLNGSYITDFSFWSPNFFSTYGIQPVYSYILSIFFRLFGIGDRSIIIANLFLFITVLLFTFFLVKKLHDTKVAIISLVSVLFSNYLINLVLGGASEVVFISEILLAFYLILLKKKVVKCTYHINFNFNVFDETLRFYFYTRFSLILSTNQL